MHPCFADLCKDTFCTESEAPAEDKDKTKMNLKNTQMVAPIILALERLRQKNLEF